MRLTISGLDKTVGMHFALHPNAAMPPPLRVRREGADDDDRSNDLEIPFAPSYVYIGQEVTADLDPRAMQACVLRKLKAAVGAFLAVNVLAKCSLSMQRSYVLSLVVGSSLHLMAMAPSDSNFEKSIDATYLNAVAKVFRTNTEYLGLSGLADLRVLPAAAVLARAYERFRLSATIHRAAAGDLLRVIDAEQGSLKPTGRFAQRLTRTRSWCASYYALMRRAQMDPDWTMSHDPEQSPPWYIHARAAALASRVAYTLWLSGTHKYVQERRTIEAADPVAAARAPPPKLYAIRARKLDEPTANPLPESGMYRATAYGGGVGGSILSYIRLGPKVFIILHRARWGRAALFNFPMWPVPRNKKAVPRAPRDRSNLSPAERQAEKAERDEADAATAARTQHAAKLRREAIFSDTSCNLCGAGGGDAVHLCTTCPSTSTRREAALGGGRWAARVSRIADAVAQAYGKTAGASLHATISATPVDSAEAVFITSAIVTCSPWKAASVPPDWQIAARLGSLFGRDIPNSCAAGLADVWATEAHAILTAVTVDWWKLLSPEGRARLNAAHWTVPDGDE